MPAAVVEDDVEVADGSTDAGASAAPPQAVSADDVEVTPSAKAATPAVQAVSPDDVEVAAPPPVVSHQDRPLPPTATMQAHKPTLMEQARGAVANSAIGHALQSTVPVIADRLGLTPTENDASPAYQQHAQQLIAPEYVAPVVSNVMGVGRGNNPTQASSAGENRIQGALRALGGLTSADNLALMGGTAVAAGLTAGVVNPVSAQLLGRLVSGGFTVDMLRGLYQQNRAYRHAVDSGNLAEAQKLQGAMGVNGVMALLTAAHAAHPAGKVTGIDHETGLPIVDRSQPSTIAPAAPDATRGFTAAANADRMAQIAASTVAPVGASSDAQAANGNAAAADPVSAQHLQALGGVAENKAPLVGTQEPESGRAVLQPTDNPAALHQASPAVKSNESGTLPAQSTESNPSLSEKGGRGRPGGPWSKAAGEVAPAAEKSTELPADLAKSKPRYGYRDKNFDLDFEDPRDLAAYTLSQKTPNKAHDRFLDYYRDQFGTTAGLAPHGRRVQDAIKNLAKDAAGAVAPELKLRLASTLKNVDGAQVEAVRAQKEPARLVEKLTREGQPAETVPDYLAARVVVDSKVAKDAAVKALEQEFRGPDGRGVVKVDDTFQRGDEDFGYRQVSLQVKMPNGMTAEVQVVPREVAEANPEQHKDYEAARTAEIAGNKSAFDQAATAAKAKNDAAMGRFEERNGAPTEVTAPEKLTAGDRVEIHGREGVADGTPARITYWNERGKISKSAEGKLEHRGVGRAVLEDGSGRSINNVQEAQVKVRVARKPIKGEADNVKQSGTAETNDVGAKQGTKAAPVRAADEEGERNQTAAAAGARGDAQRSGGAAAGGAGEAARVVKYPPGFVGRIPVAELLVDPKRLQYKMNVDEAGATNKLKDVPWNEDLAGTITTWLDPEDGKVYVVNGHHRFDLARRSGQGDMAVKMLGPEVTSARLARAVGARENIAHGTGTTMDAAKFMRDSGATPEMLKRQGISLSGPIADGGVALAKLDQRIFDDVVAGRVPEKEGIAIGKSAQTPAQQEELLKAIRQADAKGKPITEATLQELARQVQMAGEQQVTQTGLFGTETRTFGLALKVAEVSAYVRNLITTEKRWFGSVADAKKAEVLKKGDNTLNVAKNKDIAARANEAAELYDRLSARTGPVYDALQQAAREITDGTGRKEAAAIKARAYDTIRNALAALIRGGDGGSEPGVQSLEPGRSSGEVRAASDQLKQSSKPSAAEVAANLRALGVEVGTGAEMEDRAPGPSRDDLERAGQGGMFARRTQSNDTLGLPGMGDDIARQRESAEELKGEEQRKIVERALASVKEDISKAAGEMERHSPLFFGSDANEQRGLFRLRNENEASATKDIAIAYRRPLNQRVERVSVESFTNEGGQHFVLNPDAYVLIHDLVEFRDGEEFGGVYISDAPTQRILKNLRTIAVKASSAEGRQALTTLADALDAGRNTKGGLTLMAPDWRPHELIEEYFHAWQDVHDGHPKVLDALTADPVFRKIGKRLAKLGYDINDPDDPDVVVKELTAKAAANDPSMNFTAAERERLLEPFLEMSAKYGSDLKTIPLVDEASANIIEKAQESVKHVTGDNRRGNRKRDSGGDARRAGRVHAEEPLPVQRTEAEPDRAGVQRGSGGDTREGGDDVRDRARDSRKSDAGKRFERGSDGKVKFARRAIEGDDSETEERLLITAQDIRQAAIDAAEYKKGAPGRARMEAAAAERERKRGGISESTQSAKGPGEMPGPSALERLTARLKGKPFVKRSAKEVAQAATTETIRAVKEDLQSGLKGLAKSREALRAGWDRLQNPPATSEYMKAFGQYELARTEGALDQWKLAEELTARVPDRLRREAMSNWIQADGDLKKLKFWADHSKSPFKAGYEAALKLTADEQAIARDHQRYFDEQEREAKKAGFIEQGKADYLMQIYDGPGKDGLASLINLAALKDDPSIFERSAFRNYFEAESAGRTPKNKDLGFLTATYDKVFGEAVRSRAMIRQLLETREADGRPTAILRRDGRMMQIGPENEPYLLDHQAQDDGADPLRTDYVKIDHPVMRGWFWQVGDLDLEDMSPKEVEMFNHPGKGIALRGDVYVHPAVEAHLKNMLSTSLVKKTPVLKELLWTSQMIKNLMFTGSGTHQVIESTQAVMRGVSPINLDAVKKMATLQGWANPFRLDDKLLELDTPDKRLLVSNGLVLADFPSEEAWSEGMSSGMARYLGPAGKMLADYHDFLFHDLIPKMKMAMALKALKINRLKYSAKLDADAIAEMTAKQANQTFGGMNWKRMGVSPTAVDIARLVLLAPDFQAGKMSNLADLVKLRGGYQRRVFFRGALAMYATARVLNSLANGGDAKWDKDDAFSLVVGGRRYSLRTEYGDALQLLTDPVKYAMHRGNPLLTRTAIEVATRKDEFGRAKTPLQIAGDTAKGALPLTVQGLAKNQDIDWQQSFLSAMGVADAKYYTPAEDLAHRLRIAHLPQSTEDAEETQETREARHYKDKLRAGTMSTSELWDAVGAGKITPRQAGAIQRNASMTVLEENVQALGLKEALDVYDKANVAEREDLKPIVEAKTKELEGKPTDVAAKLQARLEKIYGP